MATKTDVCVKCAIAYPVGLVSTFVTATSQDRLCGICALERLNEVHGTRFREFRGAVAEGKRQAALAYRATVAWR